MPQNIASENWLIVGIHPVGWRIPVTINKTGLREDQMIPVLPLIPHHQQAFDDAVCNHAIKSNDQWFISPPEIKEIGERLPDGLQIGELQRHFSWGIEPETPFLLTEKQVEKMEFLGFLHRKIGFGQNVPHAQYLWNQLEKALMEWMLVKHRQIDLGFIKLHLSPLRENWKEMLYPKINVAPPYGKNSKKPYRRRDAGKNPFSRKFLLDDFREEYQALNLLAINSLKRYCHRTIEIEYAERWRKAELSVETDRMAQLGRDGYVKNFMQDIGDFFAAAARLYTMWENRIKRPPVRLLQGDIAGNSFFAPDNRYVGLRQKHRKNLSVSMVVDAKPRRKSITKNLPETYGNMPEVFAVVHELEDVWTGESVT